MPKSQSRTTTFWHIHVHPDSRQTDSGSRLTAPVILETDSCAKGKLPAMHTVDISIILAISVGQTIIVSDADLQKMEKVRSY